MKKNNLVFILLLSLWGFNFGLGQSDLKVGLVLSGGGAKGYAHIGVIEVLEEAGIKVDYIGGTSMGAIVGGLYASGYSAAQMRELIKDIDINQAIFEEVKRVETPFFSKLHEEKYFLTLEFDNFKLQLPRAISDGQGTLNILTEYLSHVHDVSDFNKLPIPFLCIATDVETGQQKIFKSGFLPEVVLASGAYPTLFEPVEIDDHYYIDGGVLNNFPAQEVIDMGADYIIGVDLGAGLNDFEDFSGVTSIIEQIISFGIESKTEEQRKLVDLLIVPDVKKISVTSFELKDSIMQEGYKSADALRQTLDSLQKRQSPQRYDKQPLAIDSLLTIRNIELSGLSSYSRGYILGKLGIEPPDSVSYDAIIDGIATLYATENFTQITHRLSNNSDNTKTLHLAIEEKKNKFFARFGLHYDYLLKTALLANFTAKNLLTINSTLSIDAIVGDNPRFNLNYFVDNGIRPSFGFNSSYKSFDVEKLEFMTDDNDALSYNYILQNFYNQLYMQSTLAERYAAGIGVEHNYLQISTKNVEVGNPLRNIQNASFLIPYAFLRADSRDNSFFPKSGLYMDSTFKYFVGSTQEDFESTSMFKTFVEYNQTIYNRLTFQASSFLGLSFDNRLPNGFNYLLGGLNKHNILNSFNLSGIPFARFSGRNTLGIGVGLQYAIKNRHFIKYNFDAAHLSDDFILNDTHFKYSGHGLTYGYLSPVGPLQGSLTYSPNHKEIIPYISLGYWF